MGNGSIVTLLSLLALDLAKESKQQVMLGMDKFSADGRLMIDLRDRTIWSLIGHRVGGTTTLR